MALNFSHRPIVQAHFSEDNLVAPMRIGNGYLVEGISEKIGDGFGKAWHDAENCFDYGRDRCDRASTQESVSKDIIDLLPSDPFGMDISSTFTAITGWLEDLEIDYGKYTRDDVGTSDGNYQLFAGLNFFWNNAILFHAFPGSTCIDNKSHVLSGFGECSQKEVGDASSNGGFESACDMDDMLCFSYKDEGIASRSSDPYVDVGNHLEDKLTSHPDLSVALGYLGVRDLLAVETVCKSLHSTVRGDPFLWTKIHIEQPLNEKLTDDLLVELTNRAQGHLQCLSLVECTRITDDGLKRVLEINPKLTKLSVPGCTRLSIEGIVSMLKAFKSIGTQGVKHLRIGGLYGVTHEHFEDLKLLLGTDSQMLQHSRNPHFYRRGNLYLSCDDDRVIDIEMCPRCQNLRLVYDCPAEGCQGTGHSTQACRACTLCIARCSQCGQCINDNEYEETFCLELLCSGCSSLVKCSDGDGLQELSSGSIFYLPGSPLEDFCDFCYGSFQSRRKCKLASLVFLNKSEKH
ncbi:F-box protein SKIP14 [Senna tora]|uniref:F-box protein SKIP14 n=1 Tax=Senna tora TaxID=362788 RepID=A0A834W926_9FABA|nr:F-box protein SKIP14 [Senna tora]